MDPHHFDRLSRELTLARSRRSALAAVVGGVLGLLGLAETTAKHKKKHKKKHSPPASPPSPPPSPPPPPPCVPQCAATNDCGSNGCGGSCGTCTGGAVCQAGHCVNGSLAVGDACDATLRRACTSGVCGCIGASCTCRNQGCLGFLSFCGEVADCCSGECVNAAPFGMICGG